MTLTKRIHETHVRLGVRSSNCAECWANEPKDKRPAWLRNLAAKDMTGQPA